MLKTIIEKSEIIISVLFIFVFIVVFYFVYNNVYKTSIQVEKIAVLNQKVTPVSLKKKLWSDVKGRLDRKKAKYTIPESIRDPFNF